MANFNCPPVSVLVPRPKLKSLQSVFTLSSKLSTTLAFALGRRASAHAPTSGNKPRLRVLRIIAVNFSFRLESDEFGFAYGYQEHSCKSIRTKREPLEFTGNSPESAAK